MKILISLLMLIFTTSCSEELLNSQELELSCSEVILDADQYKNSETDSFELIRLNVEKECLKVSIRYGGGCEDVSVKLIDSEDVLESSPVQRNLRIILDDNDQCEALVEQDFFFNISDLKVENESEILLNFQGSDLTYTYSY